MRGRTVLFVVLAVTTALLGAYLGWATTTPKAVGEPAPATPADPPAGSVQPRPADPGPLRAPAASPQQARQQAGSPTAARNPGGTATQPGHQPATKPVTKPAPKPPPSPGPVRFGKVTTTPSGGVVTSVAESDRRALTTTFDDREVKVGAVGGNETGATSRSFSITMPLTGGAKGETLRLYVQGYAFAAEGAYARLTLKLNGQATIRYYRSGWDDSFVEVLEVPAIPATTYQLQGVLEVDQGPGTDGTADMDVLSVDASIKR